MYYVACLGSVDGLVTYPETGVPVHGGTRASRSTCTPRKHYCEMTDNTNAHVASCTCS